MDAFRQWALCVIIAAAAGAFFFALSPRGAADKAMRAVTGIFVVASICAPLADVDIDKISVPAFAQMNTEHTDGTETYDLIFSACRDAAENEILSVAVQCGITVNSVALNAYYDNEKCIIIQDVRVNIQKADTKTQKTFLSAVEERLGVPVTMTAE